ncbi:MAG: hypothetical protein GKR90_14010 [Pseudomonadales bacterium]|nr:hypothetical protein [Pseudomonadales bacterium]
MFRNLYLLGSFITILFSYQASASVSASAHSAPEQQCLALAIYWEARGEGAAGMYAVGSVVVNRVSDERFPDTVCRVVKQGGESPPCQFSWWCDGKSDRPTDIASWKQAMEIADKLLHSRRYTRTRGALYFHSTAVQPRWRLKRVAKIGNHIFYI